MNDMQLWQPKVTRRPHPSGAAGIRASLDEVAKRVREGFDHPDVRAWAGQKLWEAGDPKGNMNRAKALFTAMKAQNIYVNDPQNVEYMAGAHIVLGDGKTPPKMRGIDCDEWVIGYLSACESIGIRTAICGAAYDEGRNITHVLGMVTDDHGNWHYADLSTDFPFGEAKKATYEDVIDVQTGKHICASDACSIPLTGKQAPDLPPGRFVGVDGLPGMLGDEISQVPTTADYDSLRALSARLGASWDRFVDVYTDMQEVSAILGAPAPGDAANKVWTPDVEQTARDAQSMVAILRMALDQAVGGGRQVALVKIETGPMAGVVDTGIQRLPTDPYYVALDQNMRPRVFQTSDNAAVSSSGQIAGWPVVVGLVLVGSAIVAYVVDTVIGNQTKQAQIAADAQKNERQYDLIKGGSATPEQLAALAAADAKVKEMEAKTTPAPIGTQIATAAQGTADSVSSIVTTVVGGAAVLAVGYVAFQMYQKRGKLWPSTSVSPANHATIHRQQDRNHAGLNVSMRRLPIW